MFNQYVDICAYTYTGALLIMISKKGTLIILRVHENNALNKINKK